MDFAIDGRFVVLKAAPELKNLAESEIGDAAAVVADGRICFTEECCSECDRK